MLIVRANTQKIGTLPSCSRRIFSPAMFNQSRCRIFFRFASREQSRHVENRLEGAVFLTSERPLQASHFDIFWVDTCKESF